MNRALRIRLPGETPAGAGLSSPGSDRGRERDAGLVPDGGVFRRPEAATALALGQPKRAPRWWTSAASPRGPAPRGVPAEEELRRIEPVLERLQGCAGLRPHLEVLRRTPGSGSWGPSSSTTSPPCVATPSSPESWPTAAPTFASCTCSASRATMQDDPRYDDVFLDAKAFLEERLAFAVGAGIPEEHVCLDPGIGFGKTVAHNVELSRAPRRTGRAREAGARRGLAKALSRAPPRRSGRRNGPGVGRRGRRSPSPSSEAPPCSASTTSASTSRR